MLRNGCVKMYRVVETFSGIGSQAQALKNIEIRSSKKIYDVVATVEWDINAICAYDILHNDNFDIGCYKEMNKEELVEILLGYTLSADGKKPLTKISLTHMSEEALKRILLAIERNKNFVSIKDVNGVDLPLGIDILTYSFPCQDLSICGFWHGNTSGIDRSAMNRSGLLWEIERILYEMTEKKINLPRILLMENVSNILSDTHKQNFDEWKKYLRSVGYYNHVYKLSANDFGIPQTRERVFMISIQAKENQKSLLDKYFLINSLEQKQNEQKNVKRRSLQEFLRLNYKVKKYRKEADDSQPNFTPSRQKIYEESRIISNGKDILCDSVTTITTKQDRNPNSGLILHEPKTKEKAPYRNLTGRECILLMGFEEEQFNKLEKYNFSINKSRKMLVNSKYIKMAGNSIVVQVLEHIFTQIMDIDELLGNKKIKNVKEKEAG